ncbi:tetratricopeptide repeat protein [Pontibacter burrus]|uniref:Tetratricopeptide repeat protein n=1 Tax=Pontibacter burrus TaxID=2704466 RepID=A0A6B3LVM2_9BACT|nr:tetratricopeptide repeat protein [Pontibacter burrus]NEM98336.1 tetratricopeptide repeat protein [Pontibacter burrus]
MPFPWLRTTGKTPAFRLKYKPAGKTLVVSFVLLLFIVCSSMISTAPDANMRRADKAYAKADFAEAAVWYQKVLDKDPDNTQALYKLGISYLEMCEPRKARLCLDKVNKLDPRFGQKVIVNLAEALHQNYEFEEAKKYYQQEIYGTGRADWNYVEVIRKRIDECNAGMELLAQSSVAQVVNMGAVVNSAKVEFAPVLGLNDSLLVFSAHDAPEGPEEIRFSHKKDGQWQNAKEYIPASNAKTGHSIVTISPDGKLLYTYSPADGLRSYDQSKGKWVNPKPMPIPLNRLANETSVHISADGQFAFFASDRPGGFGGLDLYVSQRFPDGTWSAAINLGADVNTPYDEDSPFVDFDTKTLFFSSRGHNTMGGFDIFRSELRDGKWQKAQNLGYPINSPHDDMYFTLNRKRTTAYFSSDRPGGMGALDLYQILFSEQ